MRTGNPCAFSVKVHARASEFVCMRDLLMLWREKSPVVAEVPLTGPDQAFLAHLELSGRIDGVARSRASSVAQSSGQDIDLVLLELGLIRDGDLADASAQFLGLARMQADQVAEAEVDERFPIAFAQQHGLVLLQADEQEIWIATARPLKRDAIDSLAYYAGRRVIPLVATASEIQALQQRQRDLPDGAAFEASAEADDLERMRDAARDAPTIKLVNRLINGAVEQKASDIHIEPLADHVRVRYRIDGALRTVETLPKSVQAGFTSRVKILAKLNIAEQRLPQDGRMRVPVRGRDIDFRVSTTPVLYGESLALRILDREQVPLDFATLGFSHADIDALSALSASPNGIILVTGPTGSGKTTTLYAALQSLNRVEAKIFTVEDPVEYHLAGINQIQVKPQIGLDFAAILRSVLRQDPDIIMVGEIRDRETAGIAIQAALTGHLVFSTLHTNSAAASITRLIDMGVEDYLLVSSLRGIVAQRLVRKLCPHCRTPERIAPQVARRFALPDTAVVQIPQGCAQCGNTGYKGRIVLAEMLAMTEQVKSMVLQHASHSEIEAAAFGKTGQTLLRHGLKRVVAGETSLDEVMRVVSEADS
jgi:general secretion pathway protein E